MLKFEIKGNDIQVIEVELAPGESVMAEAGAMLYMEAGISYEARTQKASEETSFVEQIINTGSRFFTGDTVFYTYFENTGTTRAKVAFTTSYPGTLVPIELPECAEQSLILQRNSFVCASPSATMGVFLNPNWTTGLLGSDNFILQKATGTGTLIAHAAGSVIEKVLYRDELRVEPGSIVAFEPSVNFEISAAADNLSSMVFGNEGLLLGKLSGEGRVWLQSLPVQKLLYRLTRS